MEPTWLVRADGGLALGRDAEGTLRVAFGERDWLGPLSLRVDHAGAARHADFDAEPFEGRDDLGAFTGIRLATRDLPFAVRASVRAYPGRAALFFRLEAASALAGFATGALDRPSLSWPAFRPLARREPDAPRELRSYGHQLAEFALPLSGDFACRGFVMAGHRPPVAEPLLFIADDLRTLLLSPFSGFHEQVIAVPKDEAAAADGIRCGWHGDLDEAPAGFATDLVLLCAPRPRAALDTLGGWLRERHGTRRPSRYADPGVGRLSYWTDNGAVYYYRTEPGEDYTRTLSRTVASLHEAGVPVRSVQLDSWFYPHEKIRPVSDEGAPVVPPTGMMRWEPREDLFPDGFEQLQERLGGLPLTFHSRHFSKTSPYFGEGGHAAWRDEAYAHPEDPTFYELLLEQAAGWGAITYEQDWMVESFLGVRGLRAAPGRARAWQEAMDRAARERGMTLQWCMATPADFLQTVTLTQVTSIRTSGDYRYLFENGLNWVWFLHGNALARALGLHPYKDVFLTHGDTGLGPAERYVDAESLLAALSAGPVGIGDRRGHTDRDVVLRTCREDGVLVKPDVPLAALDRCFRENAFLSGHVLLGETVSRHPAGTWLYLPAFNAARRKERLAWSLELAELGALRPAGPVMAWDWHAHTFRRLEPDGGLSGELGWQEHSYTVLCPITESGLALFGDVSKYATAGDRRVAHVTATPSGLRFDLLGVPGTVVEVQGFAPAAPRRVSGWDPASARTLPVQRAATPGDDEGLAWRDDDGRFVLRVRLGDTGRVRIELAR